MNRKKRETAPVPPKVPGEIEAKIIALSRGEPPPGYSPVRLLEEKSKTALGIEVSDSAICGVLKKTPLKPHQKKCWCIPPKQNAAFAANMEDVLEVYHRLYDEKQPVVCMGGQPVQLPGEKREPAPMNERHGKREDNGYIRKGTCGVFMFVEPLGGGGGMFRLHRRGHGRTGRGK